MSDWKPDEVEEFARATQDARNRMLNASYDAAASYEEWVRKQEAKKAEIKKRQEELQQQRKQEKQEAEKLYREHYKPKDAIPIEQGGNDDAWSPEARAAALEARRTKSSAKSSPDKAGYTHHSHPDKGNEISFEHGYKLVPSGAPNHYYVRHPNGGVLGTAGGPGYSGAKIGGDLSEARHLASQHHMQSKE